jgi:23S rRNA pseudouridine2605 synthase
MRKFNKTGKSFSDKKKPSFRSKPGAYKKDGGTSDRGEKTDKEGYKAKRSFTKDRDYKSKDASGKSRGGFGSGDKGSDFKEKRTYGRSKDSGDKKSFGKGSYNEKSSFGKRDDSSEKREYKPFAKRDGDESGEKRIYTRSKDGVEKKEYKGVKKDFKPYVKREGDADKPKFRKKKPFADNKEPEKLSYKAKRSFTKNKEYREGGGFFKKDTDTFFGKKEFDVPADFDKDKKPGRFSAKADSFGRGKSFDDKKPFKRNDKYKAKSNDDFKKSDSTYERKPYKKDGDSDSSFLEKRVKHEDFEEGKTFSGARGREFSKDKRFDKKSAIKSKASDDGLTRLNKYLANAGIASRREADTLIKSGVVKVNGVPVTEMGYKIKPGDTVTYGDAAVKGERKVYLLLNKPKDYITTVDDPQERKTVMELISGACRERIYPVGRLDRNTTGLLLFTNDGELTKKLTHPKHEIKKVYHVSLNKSLKPDDFKAIIDGVELEDGPIHADDLAFVGEGKKEVGIEVHSGRNRIIRRLFEHLGYEVLKLDRVTFASLTKKDLPRGKHRFLTPKEVNFLQMIG